MFTIARLVSLCVVLAAVGLPPAALAQSGAESYVIGPKDLIVITIFDQPALGGRYTVDADGTIAFPHLGPVKAGGLTVRNLEESLRRRLGETLFRNPQVTVGIETFRSKRIFIMGEVRSPGQQQLTGSMRLIEALAGAGGLTPTASGDALIVRSKAATPDAPVLPGQDQSAELLEVDLTKLQQGDLSQNLQLQDGDTLYIRRADTIYIFGEVRGPGAYAVQKNMTVLQALSLAGGHTENGALNRIRIVRIEDGKKVEIKVKNYITEPVKPGDTIMVPERWF